MKHNIPIALLVAGAFLACNEAPVGVDDLDGPLLANEGVHLAKGGVQLPRITGGGITLNNNSGFGNFVAHGGFSAKAIGAGVVGVLPVFLTPVTVWPATGQVQAKSVPLVPLGSLHAKVVCIANLGPSSGVGGGGNLVLDSDVWEIRIRVTKSSTLPVGFHGSIFVQDNGRGSGVDFADENFAPAASVSSTCGLTTSFGLEPVLQGSIQVHD